MKKNPKVTFDYNSESGIATCRLEYDDQIICTTAKCHPDDERFKSEITGCDIAETKAYIKLYKYIIKTELEPKFEALQHLLSTIQDKEKYKDDYCFNRIQKEFYNALDELCNFKSMLSEEKEYLRLYIENKDKLHQMLIKLGKVK